MAGSKAAASSEDAVLTKSSSPSSRKESGQSLGPEEPRRSQYSLAAHRNCNTAAPTQFHIPPPALLASLQYLYGPWPSSAVVGFSLLAMSHCWSMTSPSPACHDAPSGGRLVMNLGSDSGGPVTGLSHRESENYIGAESSLE